MAFFIRRIVTGHDDKGRAIVAMDKVIPFRAGRFDDGTHVQEYWQTDSLPPRQDGGDAVAERAPVTPNTGAKLHMNEGDIMIQRGTAHAWFNRGSEPARIAFVLVDGAPQREGSIQRGGSAT